MGRVTAGAGPVDAASLALADATADGEGADDVASLASVSGEALVEVQAESRSPATVAAAAQRSPVPTAAIDQPRWGSSDGSQFFVNARMPSMSPAESLVVVPTIGYTTLFLSFEWPSPNA